MGFIDRDYMPDRRRQRPFGPPPERFDFGTLGMVLVFCAARFFLYKVAEWKLTSRRSSGNRDVLSKSSTAANSSPAPAL